MKILNKTKHTVFVEDEHGPLTGDMHIRMYWERVDTAGREPFLRGWILSKEEWKLIDTQPESEEELAVFHRLHEDIVGRSHDVIIDPEEPEPLKLKVESIDDALDRDLAFSRACEIEPEEFDDEKEWDDEEWDDDDYEFNSAVDPFMK